MGGEAASLQVVGHQPGDLGLILDDQDLLSLVCLRCHAVSSLKRSSSSGGKVSVQHNPPSAEGEACILPPWALTRAAAMERPRPLPPLARLRELFIWKRRSVSRSSSPSGTPGALSSQVTRVPVDEASRLTRSRPGARV